MRITREMFMKHENAVTANSSKFKKFAHSLVDKTTIVAISAIAIAPAFAEDLAQPDTSKIVGYIGYATGAVVAIGSAKLIPAAAIWLYSKLASMVIRG